MSLVSLKTNLKSLRYGQDRVGGGSSNQPYIKSPIPDNSSSLDRSGGVDFILRGGTLTPSRAAKDVSRLTQMFFDFKSSNGPLFIAKQNLLSRTNVKTQASGILNQGAYLPTSTILQAAGNAFGIHLNKQGLDPTKRTGPDTGRKDLFGLLGLRDPLGLPIYSEAVTNSQNKKNNRLVQLKDSKIGSSTNSTQQGVFGDSSFRDILRDINPFKNKLSSVIKTIFTDKTKNLGISSNNGEILRYGGGPGSRLGVGQTAIRRYSNTNEGIVRANKALAENKSLYGKTLFKNTTPSQTSISILEANILGSLDLKGSTTGINNLRNAYFYTNTSEGETKSSAALPESKSLYGKTLFKNITPSQTSISIIKANTPSLLSLEASTIGVDNLRNLGNPYLYTNTSEGKIEAKTAQPKKKSLYGKTPFKNVTPTQTSKDGVFKLRTNYQTNAKTNTNSGLDFDIAGNDIFKGTYYVLDSTTTFNFSSSRDNTQIQDFRTEIPSTQIFPGGKKNILSAAPDYKTKNIEQRVNLGDPGRRNKDISSYTKGLSTKDSRDLINAHPLYKSSKANHGGDRNDLCKFSIGIIDNDNPSLRTYIHFRAFLDSMDDNYTAGWDAFKYMGRGENFYRYGGFDRTINLGWTVAAQSKEELIPMYQKLNFLASSLAPDYSANGYMRGNLAVLTVGGYLFEQPGIIKSINYTVPTESPWEIGISDTAGFDHTVKEIPHIIKVTGFSFTPIHTFVPGLQKNEYNGAYTNKNSDTLNRVISEFGKERFIALSRDTDPDAFTTNYNLPNDYTFGSSGIKANLTRSQPSTIINIPSTIPGIITNR